MGYGRTSSSESCGEIYTHLEHADSITTLHSSLRCHASAQNQRSEIRVTLIVLQNGSGLRIHDAMNLTAFTATHETLDVRQAGLRAASVTVGSWEETPTRLRLKATLFAP